MPMKSVLMAFLATALFAGAGHAGDRAQGYGATPTEAIDNAIKTAEKIVQIFSYQGRCVPWLK